MYVLSWSVGPLSLCFVLSGLYHVHSVFSHWHCHLGLCLFVLCFLIFTPCAQCVLSVTWSVGPLSFCLVSSRFTPCAQRVLSLTWSVGSLSHCLMSSSFTPCV